MWILTLAYNDKETHHVFRSGSLLKVGRSHEYRHDPNALYIGDLKVPKVYITVKVGRVESCKQPQKSPLSIVFESRCTTKINGSVYKLASKDSMTFEKVFREDELLLVVNANQSENIKIRIVWVPVTLAVFSKRVQYNDIVQESPLVSRVSDMVAQGVDLRTTTDPMLASHYLALTAHMDFNLQIALSRAIPIVSGTWCDYVTTHLSDVTNWLYEPKSDLYLQTENMFSVPDPRRSKMLEKKTVALDPDTAAPKMVTRLKTWLSCLGAKDLIMVSDDMEAMKNKLRSFPEVFVFVASDKQDTVLFGNDINTQDTLWQAVTAVDTSLFKQFKTDQLFNSEKRSLPDESPKKQRRVRRKIERVSDTDFFSFTPITSSLAPEAAVPEQPSLDATLFSSPEKKSKLLEEGVPSSVSNEAVPDVSRDMGLEESLVETNQTAQISEPSDNSHDTSVEHEKLVKSKTDTITDGMEKESRTTSPTTETPNESVFIEDSKNDRAGKLMPQKSFAEAVISTKKSALSEAKEETKDTYLDEEIPSCKIEVFQLNPSRGTPQESSSFNPLYKGRKNFKTFKKNGKTPNFVTRTYISLQNDENHVIFNNQRDKLLACPIQGRDKDFSGEMPTVKGFQPQSSQLFVAEEGSDDEFVEFSMTSRNQVQDNQKLAEFQPNGGFDNDVNGAADDDDDDDDDVAFTFSKRS